MVTDEEESSGSAMEREFGLVLENSVLPMLQSQSPVNLTKHDLNGLIKAIFHIEKHILDFEQSSTQEAVSFYSAFVALASNCLITNASALPKSQINQAANACWILIQYLLHAIQVFSDQSVLTNTQLINLIQGLCDDSPALLQSDILSLSAILKTTQLPSELAPRSAVEGPCSFTRPIGESTDEVKESSKRLRLDHSCESFLEQLMTPIVDPFKRSHHGYHEGEKNTVGFANTVPDSKNVLIAKNLFNLQQFGGANILLDFVMALPTLSPFIQLVQATEEGVPLKLPTNVGDALNLIKTTKNLIKDYDIMVRVLNLPILEPLTEDRLSKIITTIHAGLYISVTLVTASSILAMSSGHKSESGGDDADGFLVAEIVDISLDTHRRVMQVMKQSLRVGGQFLQNAHLFASWLLLSGLKYILGLNPSKIGAKAVATELTGNGQQKVRQGYATVCISLASHAIKTLNSLLDDLKSEPRGLDSSGARLEKLTTASSSSFKYNRFGTYSAWQRVEMLMSSVNVTSLLFSLASVSYRKAGVLRLVRYQAIQAATQQPPTPASSASSNNNVEATVELIRTPSAGAHGGAISDLDEECCFSSDDSSREDDSEPILGQLFKESEFDREDTGSKVGKLTPKSPTFSISDGGDRREPQRHLSLALYIFECFNSHFVCSEIESLRLYFKATVSEAQVVILSNIIKDLDKESVNTYVSGFYNEFSKTLTSFVHNLIATEILSEEHQANLLNHLGVSPTLLGSQQWPLFISTRTLSVVAQVLLLKQRKEKDTLKSDTNNPCLNIWMHVTDQLKSLALEKPAPETVVMDSLPDINVEHAQVLMFIFHNLKLLQRKQVLLHIGQAIVDVMPAVTDGSLGDAQIHYIGKLVHFFEYMMKNLYEPPHALVEQIEQNLYRQGSPPALGYAQQQQQRGHRAKDNKDGSSTSASGKLYFHCREIEENYSKYCSLNGAASADRLFKDQMRPRFYHLMYTDTTASKDVPKLDGMSLNFVLTGGDSSVSYDDLYESLVKLLLIAYQADKLDGRGRQLTYLGTCGVNYAFSVAWRLLHQMPPSQRFLEQLVESDFVNRPEEVLYTCVWSPRVVSNKWYYFWIRDALTKLAQTQQASSPDNLTFRPEVLLKDLIQKLGSLDFTVRVMTEYSNALLEKYRTSRQVPKVLDLFALEALVAMTYSFVENHEGRLEQSGSSEQSALEARAAAAQLLPVAVNLVSAFYDFVRVNLLEQLVNESGADWGQEYLDAAVLLLRLSAAKVGKLASLSQTISAQLPKPLKKVLEKWNAISVDTSSWRADSSQLTSEASLQSIESFHFTALLSNPLAEESSLHFVSLSLKHSLNSLIKFTDGLFNLAWEAGSGGQGGRSNLVQTLAFEDYAKVVIPLQLDAALESFSGYCSQAIETIWGSKEADDFVLAAYLDALSSSFELLTKFSEHVDEKTLLECLRFIESLLTVTPGQLALEKFFCDQSENGEHDLVQLFLTPVKSNLSSSYSTRVLKLFAKLFEETDRNPQTISLIRLCTSLTSLSRLGHVSGASEAESVLVTWLYRVLCSRNEAGDLNLASNQENRVLLQTITSYIVKENSAVDEEVAMAFLKALIPMGGEVLATSPEVMGFPDLMVIMATLAGAGSGMGHMELIKAIVSWLDSCRKYLSQKDVKEKLEANVTAGRHHMIMVTTCYMLSYLADVFEALKILSNESALGRSASPVDTELGAVGGIGAQEPDSDWMEDMAGDPEDDESNGEESDEDSLCNKMCTFTFTQKEFLNQHWYHCHTCKMVDGVGVCSICARVCHAGHDVTYAKFGSFFCDCGAKEDGSCSALTKRPATAAPVTGETNTAPFRHMPSGLPLLGHNQEHHIGACGLPSSLRRTHSSPADTASDEAGRGRSVSARHQLLSRQLEAQKGDLVALLQTKNVTGTILSLVEYLTPSIVSSCRNASSVGSSIRARRAMRDLHSLPKRLESSEGLMMPTLGSQEGAFENVKLTYTGDQGPLIRQLISSNVVRRVAMCALTSVHGKRQVLAVSHEKGKITLLQLSALLKQADSSKRKLTLTRLASAPVPFTALSIAANLVNEDFLAVCGLKDCHVLTFSPNGAVLGHMVLGLQLDAGNFVIKAVWLPGSQTELAVVTSDFVKIYNLAADATRPEYHFLPPSGKVRDVTFVFPEGSNQRHVLLMTSTGHINAQELTEESSARHGPFYVTNALDVRHEEIRETSGGNISGGGVSIYYSHNFQLLFIGYASGKSFTAPLPKMTNELSTLFSIEVKSSSGLNSPTASGGNNGNASVAAAKGSPSSTSSSGTPQPLCQWSEVFGHPGLILAMSQPTNNPIVFMIRPDSVTVQEIRFLNVKAKISDVVAIRHLTSAGDMRTTLILLCEDGSLRIYMASNDATNYWLRPQMNIASSGLSSPGSKSSSKRKLRSGKSTRVNSNGNAASTQFPVDFYEHCTLMSDIEFGGNDVLQVYNVQQLKSRLNTSGQYIASTKGHFAIDAVNSDSTVVMVGARVLVGTQDLTRAPSYVEIFGRSVPIGGLHQSRWFDIPFTREESLAADKKVILIFGPSTDPNGVIMVDSIKIYGKTKEAFSWPDDNDGDYATGQTSSSGQQEDIATLSSQGPNQLSSLDRFLACALEVLEGSFTTLTGGSASSGSSVDVHKERTLSVATSLLILPFPVTVLQNIKSLMVALHPNRSAYNNHRDAAILNHVIKTLSEASHTDELDGEAYFRLISVTRAIATSRPSNVIKFSDCLAAAFSQAMSSGEASVDVENVQEMTPGNEISSSQSCLDFSQQANAPATPQRSVSFTSDVSKHDKDANGTGSAFVVYLSDIFWKLYSMRPENALLAAIPNCGVVHVDATVQSLVEIIHAFTLVDQTNVALASKLYMRLLLCEDSQVSFGAKQSIIRVLRPKVRKRKVFIPSPPHCATPQTSLPESKPGPSMSSSSVGSSIDRPARVASQSSLDVFGADNAVNYFAGHDILPGGLDQVLANAAAAHGMPAVEDLMDVGEQFAGLNMADDDQAMVELAIALSLQEQNVDGQNGAAAMLVQAAGNVAAAAAAAAAAASTGVGGGASQRVASLEGHYSDTTASPAASDDEGSTAATDGSTLRTSPVANERTAENPGSDSGGSPVESIVGDPNASGRSSAYGEDGASGVQLAASRMASRDLPESLPESDVDTLDTCNNNKLHAIRISLLERFIEALPEVREVGGVRCIPCMQVILMLSSDLTDDERDKQVLALLLNSLLGELQYEKNAGEQITARTPNHESKLIVMRLLSILMSRVRSSSSSSSSSGPSSSSRDPTTSGSQLSTALTAQILISSNLNDLCLQMLLTLLDYWKDQAAETDGTEASKAPGATSSGLLKAHSSLAPPDMSPFFLRQYVKGHADDVFELYPQLLTEMVLRLPYQLKKISNSLDTLTLSATDRKHLANLPTVAFSPAWLEVLCDYMMASSLTPYVKKQVRKLLSYICNSKERYRQIRDFHALESHLRKIQDICRLGGFNEQVLGASSSNVIIALNYDSTISLIDHLKQCNEIASSRMFNWQRFCHKDPSILAFFVQISFLLDEGVAPVVLQLLLAALGPVKASSKSDSSSRHFAVDSANESLNVVLSHHLVSQLDPKLLSQFVKCFLLESNSTSLRWQAHSLVHNLFKNFEGCPREQQAIIDTLWSLWPLVPSYGRKAIQFIDLLGYFTMTTGRQSGLSDEKEREYADSALAVLRNQNQLLQDHPNSNIYNALQSLVEFDGYFLESEPCLVCNNPEINYANVKLSSLKVDSRFTTSTQIVKLVGSHTISKITLRISDIKKSKMVKTLNVFYNNRAVGSVVELKNKSGVWHKATKRPCSLAMGQMEVKIEFPLPLVACNIMIEYAEFYENMQASAETLQCPRCSASVPATPGVCSNCGENVYQCHKCRTINYDTKDPFLCNSCGFCKYAKFDYTLTAKSTCAVDPIENEEDRKKTVQSINAMLDKADRVYKNLVLLKPTLELLLLKIQEHGFTDKLAEDTTSSGLPIGSTATTSQAVGAGAPVVVIHVNRAIQQIAQKYCNECKSSFDELSKIIQKVLASRKELVEYDNKQLERHVGHGQSQGQQASATRRDSKVIASLASASGRCYGCASATVEHCITLLKALASLPRYRQLFCSSGLLRELLDYNLRNGSAIVRSEARTLLCVVTRDNMSATAELNNMIMDKISVALKSRSGARLDFSSSVRHEIALLVCSLEREDSCWEQRLRCVMQIFLMGIAIESPTILESITLPCLRLLINLIKPEPPSSKKNKEKSVDQMATVKSNGLSVSVDLHKWMAGDPNHSYRSWRLRNVKKSPSPQPTDHGGPRGELSRVQGLGKKSRAEIRVMYLAEKYSRRWCDKSVHLNRRRVELSLYKNNWLRNVLFNRFSRTVRVMSCSLIEALFSIPSRSKEIVDMLTSCLDELGTAGECGAEFFALFHSIIQRDHWKYYLALQGVLLQLGSLITHEIDVLQELEESTLSSDLSEGCALKMMVDLLTVFVEVPTIRQRYKSRLVAFIFNGYLALRKLVVQRTKIIDETQDTLLELLEETTGTTEAETESFMSVCLDAVNKCKLNDLRTPCFIFERICSIIYPEENDTSSFFITLEKDPQQEDFLQGRMLGNPYQANESGLGPLMRDIKNKICLECELVALLDDDSGMELLVCNKIISLDLPVKEVFRKIWSVENNESESMRITYRMRGLMGDATEEFIDNLDSKDSQEVDNEHVYRMANNISRWGGLEIILQRLALVTDMSPRCRPLLLVLLKLFGHCVKVRSNRQKLIDPSLKAVEVMLGTLKLALAAEPAELAPALGGSSASSGPANVLEQLLLIMETILSEASHQPPLVFDQFVTTCGTADDIKSLLLMALTSPNSRLNVHVKHLLMRVIPFLTLGHGQKMAGLLEFFSPRLNFKKFDFEHTPDDDATVDAFCTLANAIEQDENGSRLKDLILEGSNIVTDALEYLTIHAPAARSALLATSDEWAQFTQRPALKYVLKLLTGLCSGHSNTQLSLVSAEIISVIHGLEQVSSDSHAGSLAEALLEALKQNETVAEKIELVRKQTKEEKKRLAMAVREKQLGELGMRTNERGQVTAKREILKQVEDLGEEVGLVCSICREGYQYQPTKVLGLYTYTKRCPVEPYEGCGPAGTASKSSRKTMGYSTVTHFNIVHVDCHMAAVRHARGRDEWESAALQNASTRCNGLLPLWGTLVPESAFASCLARHNTYVQEATGHRDVNPQSSVHDLKLLILKFAAEESFSLEAGGGGPQSNIHLIPYLAHVTLYVINTTRSAVREAKKIASFLEQPGSKWIDSAFESEGVLYWSTLYLLLNSPASWKRDKITFLKRFLVQAHARYCYMQRSAPPAAATQGAAAASGFGGLFDRTPKEYPIYRTSLVFFGLVDLIYSTLFKGISKDDNWSFDWPLALAEYIRNNDQLLVENADKLLQTYQDDLLSCSSFAEFCDVMSLLDEIPDADAFLKTTLEQV